VEEGSLTIIKLKFKFQSKFQFKLQVPIQAPNQFQGLVPDQIQVPSMEINTDLFENEDDFITPPGNTKATTSGSTSVSRGSARPSDAALQCLLQLVTNPVNHHPMRIPGFLSRRRPVQIGLPFIL
jgi:hypothetical protein